jgi:hypothetical protein
VVCKAEVEAPVGKDTVPEISLILQVPLWDTGMALWLEAMTTGLEASIAACPRLGVLVSILDREVFPVVCKALVDAPAGSGKVAAETAIVVWSEAKTTGTEPAMVDCPKLGVLESMLDKEVFPVPCRALVEAPVGSETVPLTLFMFQVPLWLTGWVLGKLVT